MWAQLLLKSEEVKAYKKPWYEGGSPSVYLRAKLYIYVAGCMMMEALALIFCTSHMMVPTLILMWRIGGQSKE